MPIHRRSFPPKNSPKQRIAQQTEIYQSAERFLRQYRTNELVRRRMNFSSDAMADFEGLLEVNRKICQQQMAEKASPTLPTNCAVLPQFFAGRFVRIFAKNPTFSAGKNDAVVME